MITNTTGMFEVWQVDDQGNGLFCLDRRFQYRDALAALEEWQETHPVDLMQYLVIVPPDKESR